MKKVKDPDSIRRIVFVGLSGGVDSAVTAALLKKNNYEVVGVFIKTWHPDFLSCNEEEERRDAMRVAAHLDIPFLSFDFEDVYKSHVADYMINEYKNGRTPNPDVMCNKEVKFGAFLKKAISMGADYVATGHYAQVCEAGSRARTAFFQLPASQRQHSKKQYVLGRAPDPNKDQSYFLWTLKQEQLNKILFPVGNMKKSQVRVLAKKFSLPVAEKKDSQGICFLGAVDLKDFLKHYIKEKKGKVLNQDGEEIGFHDGVVFHTLGERHGFTITKKKNNDGPYYVTGKDLKKNILYVSQNSPLLVKEGAGGGNLLEVSLQDTNWILKKPEENKKYTAQIRYHGELLSCKIFCGSPTSATSAKVIFDQPVLVAPGQSCVIYDKDVCLGGGVVV